VAGKETFGAPGGASLQGGPDGCWPRFFGTTAIVKITSGLPIQRWNAAWAVMSSAGSAPAPRTRS